MARYLNLSRAARLVGVTRGVLQKKIRAGELTTFEGMIEIEELRRAYPDTQIEDNRVLERMQKIKDEAFTRAIQTTAVLPDAEVLAKRLTTLSKELAKAKVQVSHYAELTDMLKHRLANLTVADASTLGDGLHDFQAWFLQTLEAQTSPSADAEQLVAKDTLLRIMAAQVQILPSGHEFFVEGNDSLLESALRAGCAPNYGCRDGHCGLCKATVVSGEVKKLRETPYQLSDIEAAEGAVLMCSHTAVSELVLKTFEAAGADDVAQQTITGSVKMLEHPTDDVLLVHVRTPETARLRFLAGQNAELRLADSPPTSYPIASCPCDDRNLQFHIPRPHDSDDTDELFNALHHGDALTIVGPAGDFLLRENTGRALIFVAYETGFGPIKSLIEHAMAVDAAEYLHLYWITTSPHGHYLNNLCRAWTDALDNFSYTPLLADAGDDARVSADTLARQLATVTRSHSDMADFDIYVAGPAPIGDVARDHFRAGGLPDDQLFVA